MFGRHSVLLVLLAIAVAVFVFSGSPTRCKAEGGGEPAAEKSDKAEPKSDEPKKLTGIEWFIHSSGLIGLFILGLSIYFVALVIRLFMEMKTEVAVPPEVVGRCQDLVKARDFQAVYDAAQESDSFFGRVLATGIAELPNGLGDAREAMERAGEAETADLEKQISVLAVLGTLGPMIGLLGTLKGMISAFVAIAMGGQSLNANLVALAISESLVLTFEGVGLAVPSIYFFAFFRNRVTAMSVNAMLAADQLLRFFYRTGRSKAAAGAPGAAAGAATKVKTSTLE